MLTIIIAALAGAVTVAAPCTLPVLPILVGASVAQTSNVRPLFIALGFVTSFSVVAIAFGAITQILGVDQNTVEHAGEGHYQEIERKIQELLNVNS